MRKVDYLFAGWLETSIRELIRDDARLLARFGFMLVTSVDSTTDIRGLAVAKRIIDEYPSFSFLGEGLVIPGLQFVDVAEAFNLFTGFDELWCFDALPNKHLWADIFLVAPLNLDREDPPPLLAKWMAESGCKLGLGDGIGCNYATPDLATARLLERRQATD